MPLRIVQSKQNARLKELRKLLAHPDRESHSLVGIEGPKLLEEAVGAGLRVACIFVAQGAERLLDALPIPKETEILLLPKALLDSSVTTEAPQSIAALVEPPDWTWAHLLGGQLSATPLVLILDGLQDPGNLGTIVRSAEAFGATGVVSLPGTVSAWNPKAVRASAGSIFRLPLLTVSAQECFARLVERGVKIWTTTVQAAQPVDMVDLAGPVGLLVGNEGNGVSDHLAVMASGRLTIPCPGNVESLNAAIAASVLLYEASRQRYRLCGGPRNHRGNPR
jgi:TrmH family RNA methyltransferase